MLGGAVGMLDGRPDDRPARVDPVARADEVRVGDDVGRRKSELTPEPGAGDHLPAQPEVRPQQPRRCLYVARGGDQLADPARGDHLTLELDEGHDPGPEAGIGLEQGGVACRVMAEVEVRSHRHLCGLQPLDEHGVDERLRALVRESVVERNHNHLPHAHLRDQLGLQIQAGQQLRPASDPDDGRRVRVERQDGVASADHLAVSDMDAIELSERDPPRPRSGLRQWDHRHRGRSVVAADGSRSAAVRTGNSRPVTRLRVLIGRPAWQGAVPVRLPA